jgi:hypothetical protein
MPSQPSPGIGGKNYPIQWVHIDDFSPGCYDGSNIASEEPILGTAPLGAAYRPETFCCSSIAGGALGPLPAIVSQTEFGTLGGGLPGGSTLAVITGFAITPQLDDGNYEIVVIFEADNGVDHYVRAFSNEPGVSLNAIVGPTSTNGTTPGFFGAPYPAFTRMTASGSGNPPPVLVFPGSVATDAAGANGHLWVYPELLSPTAYTAQDLIVAASSTTGQVITYGNRVICLVGVNYPHPSGGGINTNENFNYTDPPESSTYGDQMTVLSIENPWGYGAWGTMSVGELLLVKKYGGGVILNGDINVPTSVIRIPGIQSTGDFVGRAASTTIGLVYCSQDRGAWVWNGGNTSNKISENIADNFFDLETNVIGSNNYGFYVEHWNKWLVFSGNVIYDELSGGWWNLYPPHGINIGGLTGADIFWSVLTQNGNQLATSPLTVTANTDMYVSVFDNRVPSQFYQWQSLPIHVDKNADRVLDVRQVIIRASDPTNTGAATIQLKVGSFNETSTVTINNTPTPLRFNVGLGAQGLDDITLNITAANSSGNSAPIIHSIDVGYIIKAGVAVTD